MGYIENIRKLIGNHPLIMVGAAMCVLNPEGRLLMLRRTDNGCWGLPGGAMEPGESLEETAKREAQEETGLVLAEVTLFGVFSGPELYYRYPNGDEVYNVTVVYTAQCPMGELNITLAEHSEYAFFDTQALPCDTSPPIRSILAELALGQNGAHSTVI